ncbi:MAG: DUF1772 domain-containing protein [Jatrophihabitans sp.]
MTATTRNETTMIDGYLRTATLVAAIGAGLSGGVFFAFSTFIMPALRKLPDSQAISAMNSINKEAPNAWFMTVLFGTAALCVLLGVQAARRFGQQGATYLLVGSVAYLVAIVLTVAYHVPQNDALMQVDPQAAGAAATWSHYYTGWTSLNHLRTLGCVVGATFFTVALRSDEA